MLSGTGCHGNHASDFVHVDILKYGVLQPILQILKLAVSRDVNYHSIIELAFALKQNNVNF